MRESLIDQYAERINKAAIEVSKKIAKSNNTRFPSIESYDIYEIFFIEGAYVWPTEDGSIEGKSLARVMDGDDAGTWYKRKSQNEGWEPFGGSLLLIPYSSGNYQFPTETGSIKQDTLGRLVGGPSGGKLVRRNSANNGWVLMEVMDATSSYNNTSEVIPTSNIPQIGGSLISQALNFWYNFNGTKVIRVLLCYVGDNLSSLVSYVSEFNVGYLTGSSTKGFYVAGSYAGGPYPVVKSVNNKLERCSIFEYEDYRISYIASDGTEIPINWMSC